MSWGLRLGLRLSLIGGLVAGTATAQDASKDTKAAEKAATEAKAMVAQADVKAKAEAGTQTNKPATAYRLDFSVNEMEDGKKINTRQYSMNSRPGDGNEIKIGTRVPVEVKQGEFQYLDVGTNIWCRLRDEADVSMLGSNVLLNVRAELSNFASPDQQQAQQFHPVVRQMKIEASTIAIPGKSLVVGVVDDPNSKRQFQLEVTVTKLK
jgi:Tfp pilus assembly major pilin PilA